MLKPRLRVILAEIEIDQKVIADELGVSEQRFSNWVNNKEGNPRLEMAFKLAEVLSRYAGKRITVDDLWELREE